MKPFNFLLLFLFSSFISFSQISVSRSHRGLLKDLRKENFKEIKSRKTIFVVDSFEKNEFEKMINSFWNLNKYEVISRKEYEFQKSKYINEKNSIFEFSGIVVTVTNQKSNMTTQYLYSNYTYFYCTDIKKKDDGEFKYKKNEVASVFFSGDAESMWGIIKTSSYENLTNQLYNYKMGYMKNYLQFIQQNLKNETSSWAFVSDYDKKKIKALSKHTLYIPDYIKTIYNGWTGEEKERENPDDLFEDYKFKYEWISNEKLNEKILSENEDFYYLMYTKINSMKIVSIVNGKTGEIIYSDYHSFSYKLKPKDLKAINNKID